jgi:hypothetical protein
MVSARRRPIRPSTERTITGAMLASSFLSVYSGYSKSATATFAMSSTNTCLILVCGFGRLKSFKTRPDPFACVTCLALGKTWVSTCRHFSIVWGPQFLGARRSLEARTRCGCGCSLEIASSPLRMRLLRLTGPRCRQTNPAVVYVKRRTVSGPNNCHYAGASCTPSRQPSSLVAASVSQLVICRTQWGHQWERRC